RLHRLTSVAACQSPGSRSCPRLAPSVILARGRVCALRPWDSAPVRCHGPERGSTGGGGRPRSFPSDPPTSRALRASVLSCPLGAREAGVSGDRCALCRKGNLPVSPSSYPFALGLAAEGSCPCGQSVSVSL